MRFNLVSNNSKANIVLENQAHPGVKRVAKKVAEDVLLVTGKSLQVTEDILKSDCDRIVAATIGNSDFLDSIWNQVPELAKIKGKREVYVCKLLEENGHTTCLIAGSDKRGTIYGLFHLSELMGVSPWVYFADVKPAHKDEIIFDESINFVSKEPSVKYRGFFINDEWPAFGNWTFKNFGGFTAEMYDHVFELILRLKGNYLWPAMWTSSFSLDGPGLENARLADEYGIVMSNSHHEPCLRHSEEWDLVRGENSIYGNDWNFDKNRDGLIRYWADALDRNGKFENIITIGMRGERDSEILGRTATLKDNIDYLKSVITEQNKLIKEHINEDLSQVPRMLALYKEVEAYYYGDKETEGLENWEELEGVTLMLCDDNFANTRTLPTRNKKNRPGGWGLYYHFDYHGDPVSYEWVNSTHLSKVWEQLTGAYEFGIRDIWIVNVGDLKPQELPLTYFMDLAYDYEKYGITNPNSTDQYMADWAEKCFGGFFNKRDLKVITKLLDQYTWYNNIRRPESILPDTFHPTNYGESDAMLEMMDKMIKIANRLLKKLTAAGLGPDDEIYSAFYQLVYYPVTASANVFKIALLGGKNHLYAKQGRVTANTTAKAIAKAVAWDKELSDNYHKLMQGKWYGMTLSKHIGFNNWNDEECQYPIMCQIQPVEGKRMIVSATNQTKATQGGDWTRQTIVIPDMLSPKVREASLDIASGGTESFEYKIECADSWLLIDNPTGVVSTETRVRLTIDEDKLKAAAKEDGYAVANLTVFGDRVHVDVKVTATALTKENEDRHFIPVIPKAVLKEFEITEDEVGLAVEASDFAENNDFDVLTHFGKYNSGVKASDITRAYSLNKEGPYLTYQVKAPESGEYELTFLFTPANPVDAAGKLDFGIQINDENRKKLSSIHKDFVGGDRTNPHWGKGVMDNIHTCTVKVSLNKGDNTIKYMAVSPNVVLERILIRACGSNWKQGFMGL